MNLKTTVFFFTFIVVCKTKNKTKHENMKCVKPVLAKFKVMELALQSSQKYNLQINKSLQASMRINENHKTCIMENI